MGNVAGPVPLVIAHRGASGYLPEHTLAAKALAHAQGADYLEQDVVATRDGQLIVFHDLYLDDMSDVAQRFPGRQRSDGRHYCIDFDLAEIRSLRVGERRRPGTTEARYPRRFPVDTSIAFTIPTLDEELAFIAGLNRSSGRGAGIYVEIKSPEWHRDHGVDLSRAVLGVLARHGHDSRDARAFLQCFSTGELQRIRHELGCKLHLVQLLDGSAPIEAPGFIESLSGHADCIGPSLRLLAADRDGRLAGISGLPLHPYTLRADDLPPGVDSFEALLSTVFATPGVGGVFTDFPDRVLQYRDRPGARAR